MTFMNYYPLSYTLVWINMKQELGLRWPPPTALGPQHAPTVFWFSATIGYNNGYT